MTAFAPSPAGGNSSEMSVLIATLLECDRRLVELTAGEVDTVTDSEGRAFMLRRTQDELRIGEAARQTAILDALPANIALIDAAGTIIAVNAAWRRFSCRGIEQLACGDVGVNYLEVCDQVEGADGSEARRAAAGIRQVLAGIVPSFSLEYPCHSPVQQRWFLMTVSRVAAAHSQGAVVMHLDISERRLAESQSRADAQRFSDLLRNVEMAAVMLDGSARITFCNDYLLRLTGWQLDEVIGKNWFQLFIPAQRSAHQKAYAALLASVPAAWHRENQILTRAGERRLMRWSSSVLRSADGEVIGSASIGEDITAHRNAETSIKHLNRVLAVLGSITSLIVRVAERTELFQGACDIAVQQGGFRKAWIALIDRSDRKLVCMASAGNETELLDQLEQSLVQGEPAPAALVAWALRENAAAVANHAQADLRVPQGERYAQLGVRSLAVFPLLAGGQPIGVFVLYAGEAGFFHEEEIKLLTDLAGDIAFAIEHLDRSQRLDYLSLYDPLTGLPNAGLFRDRLDQLIQLASQQDEHVCVIAVDLERFTQLNDRLGRAGADALLRAVGLRFRQFLSEPYLIGRIGSDTFAVASAIGANVLPTVLRDAMARALEQPFTIDGRQVNVGAQVGIALYPTDGLDSHTVFKNAESALKLAKTSGTRASYFSHALNARITQRFLLEQQLREAIAEQQFVLHYQARVDMTSGEVVGAEALIRWQHPERGLLAPSEFIALAEDSGLIVPIGAWVINAVCAQQAAWVAAGMQAVPVAVNVSSIQFEKDDLVARVRNALAVHALDPLLLDLELTESAMMNDSGAATKTVQALKKMRVGLALDDFGTGYSSLAHLKQFPFKAVKIDRSFVADITSNPDDAAITRAIIAMAHGLGLRVIAEGVETQGQFNYLRVLACDEMQGFLFGPGVAADAFADDLRSGRRLALPVPALVDQQTLLIVDDEHGIRAALTRMLRRDGYRILHASDGQAGLDTLALHEVQVIISDQRMPGMAGTEFLSKVSQLYPDTVRIILSGYTDLNVVTEAVNTGAVFKFLIKPWDDALLREQVRDAFRRFAPRAGRPPVL